LASVWETPPQKRARGTSPPRNCKTSIIISRNSLECQRGRLGVSLWRLCQTGKSMSLNARSEDTITAQTLGGVASPCPMPSKYGKRRVRVLSRVRFPSNRQSLNQPRQAKAWRGFSFRGLPLCLRGCSPWKVRFRVACHCALTL